MTKPSKLAVKYLLNDDTDTSLNKEMNTTSGQDAVARRVRKTPSSSCSVSMPHLPSTTVPREQMRLSHSSSPAEGQGSMIGRTTSPSMPFASTSSSSSSSSRYAIPQNVDSHHCKTSERQYKCEVCHKSFVERGKYFISLICLSSLSGKWRSYVNRQRLIWLVILSHKET